MPACQSDGLADVVTGRQAHAMTLYHELQETLAAEAGAAAGEEASQPRLLTFAQFMWLTALIVRP